MDLEKVDKNFLVEHKKEDDIYFINIKEEPIKIHGLIYNDKILRYERMNNDVADSISGHLSFLNGCTSGGRIRFRTNSDKLSLKVFLDRIWGLSYFSKNQAVSFSLYVNNHFYKLFSPSKDWNKEDHSSFESTITLENKKMKDIDIYFPLYTFIKDVFVGITNSSLIKEPKPYKYELPIVFYGSSTTQGGCASRPGNSYDAFLSQSLKFDYINLGFSGNGKAELEMAEYISKLPMSVFVYDYDYNAETVEELERTHEAFFKVIRKNNPKLPIIMLPKPNDEPNKKIFKLRKEVIRKTYINAISNEDKNVYYIDYSTLYKGFWGKSHTIDGCHPNDLGFYLMAKEIKPILSKILKEVQKHDK